MFIWRPRLKREGTIITLGITRNLEFGAGASAEAARGTDQFISDLD